MANAASLLDIKLAKLNIETTLSNLFKCLNMLMVDNICLAFTINLFCRQIQQRQLTYHCLQSLKC